MDLNGKQNIIPWWNKFSLHDNPFTIEEMQNIIKTYSVGTIARSLLHMNVQEEGTLRVLVVGLQGSGKSSLIVTLLTAIENATSVQFWRCDIAPPNVELGVTATTMTSTSYLITLGAKNGKSHQIELVDSRGFLGPDDFQEGLQLATGNVPNNTRLFRGNDEHYVARFANVLPKTKGRFHLALIVVPLDIDLSKRHLLINLKKELSKNLVPMAHVFTKCDLAESDSSRYNEEHIKNLMQNFNLHNQQVLRITPFNTETNTTPNEKTNKTALNLILWLIILADSRGLAVKRRGDEEIINETLKMVVYRVLTSVATALKRTDGLILGTLVVLSSLVLYLIVSLDLIVKPK